MKIQLHIALGLSLLFAACGKTKTNVVPATDGDSQQNASAGDGGSCKVGISKVVYGGDDRRDWYESSQRRQKLGDATVALVNANFLFPSGNNAEVAFPSTVETTQNLCPGETYGQQQALAFCSGFLVAPDVVVTAGHCLLDTQDCQGTAFIFDYKLESASDTFGPTTFANDQVYTCDQLIERQFDEETGIDFAVVRLDRAVTDRTPLRLRTAGSIAAGVGVISMGHPSGMPLKIAAGAGVRDNYSNYFTANMDTFGGNSGSAVVNATTLQVEGILINGEVDYEYDVNQGCYKTKYCSNSGCVGEGVIKISEVLPYIPNTYTWPGSTGSASCPFANDGICDENNGVCYTGTDGDDCDGVIGGGPNPDPPQCL